MRGIASSLRHDKVALVAVVVSVGLILASIVASIVAPGGGQENLLDRLRPPSLTDGHILGTDPLGRDLLALLLVGVSTELAIAALALAISGGIGITLGVLAGYAGGWVESLIVFAADSQLSFPSLLIAILFVEAAGNGEISISIVLGLTFWMIFARTTRQLTRSIRRQEYTEIARVLGVTRRRVIIRHVLGNCWPTLVSLATVQLPQIILGEVSLSFLGFGITPPGVSLGLVLADGTDYLSQQWWVSTFAGVFIMVLVLSLNTTGRWLQRVLDPLSGESVVRVVSGMASAVAE